MASIFREQNLERVSNPDTLDDYIRIANPGVWMVLGVIVLLLVAAIIWGIFGTVNVDADGVVVVNGSNTTLWLQEEDAGQLQAGANFEVADQEGTVTSAPGQPVALSEVSAEVTDDGTIDVFRKGEWVSPLKADVDLPNGTYPASVVVESYSPLQLIFGAGQGTTTDEGQAS